MVEYRVDTPSKHRVFNPRKPFYQISARRWQVRFARMQLVVASTGMAGMKRTSDATSFCGGYPLGSLNLRNGHELHGREFVDRPDLHAGISDTETMPMHFAVL